MKRLLAPLLAWFVMAVPASPAQAQLSLQRSDSVQRLPPTELRSTLAVPSRAAAEPAVRPAQPPPEEIAPPGRTIGVPFTLDDACGLALQNNPLLQQAIARVESARGRMIQAGIPPNPRFDSNNPQVLAGNQSQYNAGVMQDFVTKGKLRLDSAAATQEFEQARLQYVQDRFDLLTAVRQQFYRVLAQEQRVEALSGLLELAEKSHAAAVQKEKAGEVPLTDALLLEVELEQARVAVQNAEHLLLAARRELAATIGIANLPNSDPQGDLAARLPEFDDLIVRQFVVSQSLQVQMAQRDVTRNRILVRRAQVEPFPNFTVGPAIAWGPSSASAGGPGTQAWINLQFPIPAWNRNQGNIRAANANVREAVATVGSLQNDLLRESADALGRYRTAKNLAERIKADILPKAVRTQRLVQSRYANRLVAISEVLQAQRALTQLNLSYIDALENAWSAAAELSGLLQREQFP